MFSQFAYQKRFFVITFCFINVLTRVRGSSQLFYSGVQILSKNLRTKIRGNKGIYLKMDRIKKYEIKSLSKNYLHYLRILV